MKKTLRLTSIALVLMMLLTLTACVPADADKAKEKMEKKEYVVVAYDSLFGFNGLTKKMNAVNTKTGDFVNAYWYEEASQAKEAFEKTKDDAKKDSKDESNFVCKRSGKVIYAGTKQGVKDFN